MQQLQNWNPMSFFKKKLRLPWEKNDKRYVKWQVSVSVHCSWINELIMSAPQLWLKQSKHTANSWCKFTLIFRVLPDLIIHYIMVIILVQCKKKTFNSPVKHFFPPSLMAGQLWCILIFIKCSMLQLNISKRSNMWYLQLSISNFAIYTYYFSYTECD